MMGMLILNVKMLVVCSRWPYSECGGSIVNVVVLFELFLLFISV
jgi:hypothetical protein